MTTRVEVGSAVPKDVTISFNRESTKDTKKFSNNLRELRGFQTWKGGF